MNETIRRENIKSLTPQEPMKRLKGGVEIPQKEYMDSLYLAKSLVGDPRASNQGGFAERHKRIFEKAEELRSLSPEEFQSIKHKDEVRRFNEKFEREEKARKTSSYIRDAYNKSMQPPAKLYSDPAPIPGVDKRVFQLNLASWLRREGIPEAEYYRNPMVKKRFEEHLMAELSRSALDKR